ncbi:MAG TPA: thioredoxin domain-containing protein [Phototrophicaceae bacterium]|nr:thioredoxin domain-containing protein [Phototrophicaceae bacterium]
MTSAAVKRRASNSANRQGIIVIAAVVILVVIIAGVAIYLSGGNKGGDVDVASLPQARQSDGGFVLGNPNAPITLVEFADFDCPHCQEYHPTITEYLNNYVVTGKAKFEYRVFPTAGGQLTYYTGQLLECAEDQKAGNFWKGYNLMFDYAFSGRYTQDVGRLLANDEGLDYSKLLSCASTATQVQTDINLGQQLGVTGTPAVMVRYGDGTPQFITYSGQTYNSGGTPYAVLSAVTDAVQQ